jgi:hypothetical protein
MPAVTTIGQARQVVFEIKILGAWNMTGEILLQSSAHVRQTEAAIDDHQTQFVRPAGQIFDADQTSV